MIYTMIYSMIYTTWYIPYGIYQLPYGIYHPGKSGIYHEATFQMLLIYHNRNLNLKPEPEPGSAASEPDSEFGPGPGFMMPGAVPSLFCAWPVALPPWSGKFYLRAHSKRTHHDDHDSDDDVQLEL
jgi:hypothetical protein